MVGYDVVMCDFEFEYVECGLLVIDDSFLWFVLKEKLIGDEVDVVKVCVVGMIEFVDFGDCDFVVEVVVENMDVKCDIFVDFDDIVLEGVVLVMNISMFLIMIIVVVIECFEFVVGFYFMNFVLIMKGVEVVCGEKIDDDVVVFVYDFLEVFGKEMWEFDDKFGFVINCIFMLWFNEGICVYDEGVVLKEDIDCGMIFGMNVLMGLFIFVDYIGFDICLDVFEMLFEEFGDCYKLVYLFKCKVVVGDFGKKMGKGFYEYD